MQDLEENVLKALDLPMLFYYRYVDDIVFAAQENDQLLFGCVQQLPSKTEIYVQRVWPWPKFSGFFII